MANASALLDDILTLLCFLCSDDIQPLGKRFLPPHAISTLRPLLLNADEPVDDTSPRRERDYDRLRFIHYLCEAAQLVAPAGPFLKPSVQAARWIALAPIERARQIVKCALLADSQQTRVLWQAYRLPGWKTAGHGTPMALLLHALGDASGQPVRRTALAGVLSLIGQNDTDMESLTTNLDHLLRYLSWFDMLEPQRRRICLSNWGLSLLDMSLDTPSLVPGPTPAALHVSPSGEITVPDGADWRDLFDLSAYALLIATRPRRRYRLERALICRAIQAGTTLTQIVRVLESATHAALSTPLLNQLRGWSDEFDRIVLHQSILMETDTPERLSAIATDKRLRNSIRRVLSPRIAEVEPDRASLFAQQLERRGLPPQMRLQLTSPAEEEQIPRQSLKRFDQPTLAHLYVSARLCHALADVIPTRARPPYSVVLDVEAQLSPHDRAVAEQLVDDCVQAWQAHQSSAISDAGLPAPAARHLTLLEQAIKTGATLLMNYYTPARGEAAWRKIDPIQVDRRNGIVYLLAYCHLSQVERTFRVDRILDLQPVSGPIQPIT